jgi:hypothetical protein
MVSVEPLSTNQITLILTFSRSTGKDQRRHGAASAVVGGVFGGGAKPRPVSFA